MRILLQINQAERATIDEIAERARVTPQQVLRSMLYVAQRRDLLDEVYAAAHENQIIPDDTPPGQHKGYTLDDYRVAWREHGTISGVARALGVNRATAREMIDSMELR